ncbi:hypothetical protein PHJA_000783200 [Phtheirospermum japonicum]|uniref:Uncharacterized protein n=1 Tax=Phtheirospermum japonicum TaxID=374723 RepID=A0A830BPC3_9LAMI|nr:hypothetical protein PHJA_000783200 [Phtheirospermum japonicum]
MAANTHALGFIHSHSLADADLQYHTLTRTNTHLNRHTLTAAAMVVTLGPGKFYANSLPRPRFYTDVKFNDERVDPPPSVVDPLMVWAEEAQWSMGALNFERHRRIEGNIERLRTRLEQIFRTSQTQQKSFELSSVPLSGEGNKVRPVSEISSPQPPRVAIKRRRVAGSVDEEEKAREMKKGPVRKLGDDFERVAMESGIENSNGGESGGAVAARTRNKSHWN